MFIGYSTVSSVVVLWLMLEYFYFYYLIRTVVFINRYRSLVCCTVLSGKVSLQLLLLWRISLFCLLFFLFLVVGLVLQRGCEYLLLGVDTVLILCSIYWEICGCGSEYLLVFLYRQQAWGFLHHTVVAPIASLIHTNIGTLFVIVAFNNDFWPNVKCYFRTPCVPTCTCLLVWPEIFITSLSCLWMEIYRQYFINNLLSPELLFNFSTLCIQNVNNTGTKYVRIMKQTAIWRGRKNGEYIPCLKYSVPIFVE